MKDYKELKKRQRMERDGYNKFLEVRVHRALSWLNRAEQCSDDPDGQAIFLWIAFNAAYANEIDPQHRPGEQKLFLYFLQRLCKLDNQKRLENLVWVEFSNSIRILIDNQYIFQPFWNYQNKKITEKDWKQRFTKEKSIANKALGQKNTPKVLAIVLSRVYTLRNQLIHGGATWNSRVNRSQIKDCAKFMGCLVPVVIEIMMDNTKEIWGQPCYPVV
jgi:hypothetical protein